MKKESIRQILWNLRLHEVARAINGRAILVLLYHGIAQPGNDRTRDDRVSSSELDWQIKYMVKHYDVRHVHEWIGGASSRGKPGAAITFDDGYRSILPNALPILQRYRCPATVYLCPGPMDQGKQLWFDELYCFLRASIENDQPLDKFHQTYEDVVEEFKILQPEERTERIENIREKIPSKNIRRDNDNDLLTWQEVDRLRDSGLITFGAHTTNHTVLTNLPAHAKNAEIVESFESVRERAGSCDTFSYPNGLQRDFDYESERIVRSCGMVGSVTAIPGLARKRTNRYAWPRIIVPPAITRPRFELRASGVFGEKISRRADLRRRDSKVSRPVGRGADE